jgi:hypothetical protein
LLRNINKKPDRPKLLAGNICSFHNKSPRERDLTGNSREEADLALVDRHIEELGQRIDDLKERMATMAAQSYETRNQSLLLSTMQEVMRDLRLMRLDMLGATTAGDAGSQPRLFAG